MSKSVNSIKVSIIFQLLPLICWEFFTSIKWKPDPDSFFYCNYLLTCVSSANQLLYICYQDLFSETNKWLYSSLHDRTYCQDFLKPKIFEALNQEFEFPAHALLMLLWPKYRICALIRLPAWLENPYFVYFYI